MLALRCDGRFTGCRPTEAHRTSGVDHTAPGKLKAFEDARLFCPSESPTEHVAAARGRHTEGFYVGLPPRLPPNQVNRIENRLKKSDDTRDTWFTADGKLVQLPDPLRDAPMRLAETHGNMGPRGVDKRTDFRYPNLTFTRRDGAGCAIDINMYGNFDIISGSFLTHFPVHCKPPCDV